MFHMALEEYFSKAFSKNNKIGQKLLPEKLVDAENELRSHASIDLQSYNRSLLQFLLDHFKARRCPWTLSDSIIELYNLQIFRLEHNLKNKHESYFRLENDYFRKDIALLLHRLIPFGAEFASPYSGIPRSLAIKAGPSQAMAFSAAIWHSRGLAPFLELHMHPEVTEQFNPSGWIATYERLAEFLEMNPKFRGVQSTSWFLDPALADISPRLSYLREVPEQCGAFWLFAGLDQHGTSGALDTSPTRRRLHASGTYKPRLFTRIWPKRRMLKRKWRLL